jgi:hypothetical protein
MNPLNSVSKWIDEYVPKWMKGWSALFYFGTILVLMLDTLPTYVSTFIVFGPLLVLIYRLAWKDAGRIEIPSRRIASVALISASFTFVIYSWALQFRHDSTAGWWLLAAALAFGALLLLSWLLPRKSGEKPQR